jgi:osmotically-inducible protein OsmY
MMTNHRSVMTAVMALALAASLAAAVTAAPSDSQIQADVQKRLKGLDGGSSLTVGVQDGVVTLTGTVPTLWVKEEAVKRARKASNVQSGRRPHHSEGGERSRARPRGQRSHPSL